MRTQDWRTRGLDVYGLQANMVYRVVHLPRAPPFFPFFPSSTSPIPIPSPSAPSAPAPLPPPPPLPLPPLPAAAAAAPATAPAPPATAPAAFPPPPQLLMSTGLSYSYLLLQQAQFNDSMMMLPIPVITAITVPGDSSVLYTIRLKIFGTTPFDPSAAKVHTAPGGSSAVQVVES